MVAVAPSLRFGEFTLHTQARELEHDGSRVMLRPKAYALLLELLGRAGELLTKDELLDAVWGDVAVSDSVLKVCIRELRQHLDDDPTQPRFIETRHRVGYRFIAPVARGPVAKPGTAAPIFVGRRDELATLEALLDRASLGEVGPRIACVTGEPGLGKTALVDRFVAGARARPEALLCCRGACVEQHSIAEPLTPFLDGLAALGASDAAVRDVLRSVAPTWCLQLPELFPADEALRADTLGATRPRMFRELLAALRRLSRERTVLWVIEDLHWADASTIDLVRHLAMASEQRHLLVATYRPSSPAVSEPGPLSACVRELLQHGHSETIALHPLSADEVREYLESMVGGGLNPAHVELIAERTEGHPLFLTSLVSLLLARGELQTGRDADARLTVSAEELAQIAPQGVRAMVEQKLAALDADARRLLSYASVQGIEFSPAVLAVTAGIEQVEAEEQLDPIARHHRIVSVATAPSYRFTHALYRDALYDELVPSRRTALHAAVGDALAAQSDADVGTHATRLARHFELADDPARALEHLWNAVSTAESRLASREAESLCDHALRTLEGRVEPEASREQARFHGRRGALRIASGRFAEASEDLVSMRAAAQRAGNPELEVEAIMQTFRQLGYMGRYEQAEGLATEATTLAEGAGLRRHVAEIRGAKASLDAVRGSLRSACETLADVLADLGGSGPTLALTLDLACYDAMRGRFTAALPLLEPLPAVAEAQGDAMRVGQARFWLGLAAFNAGDSQRALTVLEPALRMAERNADAFLLPRLFSLMASVHRRLGAQPAAVDWSARALAVPGVERMPDGHAHALLGASACAIDDPRDARVDERLDRVEALASRPFFGDWLIHVRLVELRARRAMVRGELDAAQEQLAQLARLAQRHDLGQRALRGALMTAQIQRMRGDADGALDRLNVLSSTEPVTQTPMVAWRIHAETAAVADACGHAELARAARERGRALVHGIAEHAPTALRAAFLALTSAVGLG